MKKTVYKVYSASAEVKGADVNADNVNDILLSDCDPNLIGTFDRLDEASACLRKGCPTIQIDRGMGHAVRYALVHGWYIAERDVVLDDDGNEIDGMDVATPEFSAWPVD